MLIAKGFRTEAKKLSSHYSTHPLSWPCPLPWSPAQWMTPCTLAVWRRRRCWERRGGCRSRCWWWRAGRWSWVSSKRRWWTRSTLTWRSLSLLWNVIFIMIIIIGQGRHWPGGVRPRPRPRDTRLAWVLERPGWERGNCQLRIFNKRKMAVIRKGIYDLHYQHLAKDKDKGSLVSTCQKGFWEVFLFAVGGRGCHQGCSSHHSLNFWDSVNFPLVSL